MRRTRLAVAIVVLIGLGVSLTAWADNCTRQRVSTTGALSCQCWYSQCIPLEHLTHWYMCFGTCTECEADCKFWSGQNYAIKQTWPDCTSADPPNCEESTDCFFTTTIDVEKLIKMCLCIAEQRWPGGRCCSILGSLRKSVACSDSGAACVRSRGALRCRLGSESGSRSLACNHSPGESV